MFNTELLFAPAAALVGVSPAPAPVGWMTTGLGGYCGGREGGVCPRVPARVCCCSEASLLRCCRECEAGGGPAPCGGWGGGCCWSVARVEACTTVSPDDVTIVTVSPLTRCSCNVVVSSRLDWSFCASISVVPPTKI